MEAISNLDQKKSSSKHSTFAILRNLSCISSRDDIPIVDGKGEEWKNLKRMASDYNGSNESVLEGQGVLISRLHLLGHSNPKTPDLKINRVILTWKVESLVELKFDPKFPLIREYKLTLNDESKLDIESPNDSQYWVKLTLNIESKWLSILSQIDSQYQVNSMFFPSLRWHDSCAYCTFLLLE